MSQLNANPSASWGPFSGPITSSDYDITDAFDLLTPPAVTQGSDNHPTSSALFYSLTNPVQTHGAPISGPPSTAPEQLEKRPSTQPDTAASALSLDSDDGPTSASDQRPKRSGSSRYTTEVKLAKNREAQRRFRLKQKVGNNLSSCHCKSPYIAQIVVLLQSSVPAVDFGRLAHPTSKLSLLTPQQKSRS